MIKMEQALRFTILGRLGSAELERIGSRMRKVVRELECTSRKSRT